MFPSDDLRERPIPGPGPDFTSGDYHDIGFDTGDPRGAEPLVDVSDFGIAGESFYARTDGHNDPYRRPLKSDPRILCRRGVAEALVAVNRRLASYGVEVFVLDAHRGVEVQQALWDHFMEHSRRLAPDAGEEELAAMTRLYCSDPRRFDPRDRRTWPVHSTGGAVDLTLRRLGTAEPLFMGGVFDDASEVSATRFFEERAAAAGGRAPGTGDEAALRHRRLLYHAMRAEGFTNYAPEWWHYDLGTQMWAMLTACETGTPALARYGYAIPAI